MNNFSSSNCTPCPVSKVNTVTATLDKHFIPILGGLGILGNLISILVLRSSRLKSTFYQSLLTLAVCDILFLIFAIIDSTVSFQNVIFIYLFPYFYNPLKNVVFSWETYLIMSIATERYLVVCKPLLYRKHKVRTSSLIHLLTFIFPGLFLAAIINIPKFFEAELIYHEDEVDFQATELRLNSEYIYYYTHLTRLLLTGIIPAIFLVAINILVISKVRTKRRKSIKLCRQLQSAKLKRPPNYLVLTLTAIIMVFLVCNLPRLILNLVEYNFISNIYKVDECGCSLSPWWIPSLIRFSHMVLTINSSVNFFIYIFFSKSFSKVFKMKSAAFVEALQRHLLPSVLQLQD